MDTRELKKYICAECGAEFESKAYSRFGIKYCSEECRYKAFKKNLNEWARKKRENKRLGTMEYEITSRGIDKERLTWLVEHQQFVIDIPKDIKCWLCASTSDLLSHHVTYFPIQEYKTLCRNCHEFLHKIMLKKHKCTPDMRTPTFIDKTSQYIFLNACNKLCVNHATFMRESQIRWTQRTAKFFNDMILLG